MARLFLAAFALLLAPFATGQELAEEKLEIRGLGTCGLVTRYASSQINDTCLQEALNVYLDEDAGISRRGGFAKYNTTAITDTKAVRGVWPFRDNDGTDYMVVLSSQTMFQSNGQGSFSVVPGLTSLSATQDMDCAQCLGKLWCVNGSDTMFSWDGSSTDTVSTAPTCQAIDCFRNRVVLGNCSGTLSQLRGSGELDGTDYTISAAPVSTSPFAISIGGINDGNKIVGIMGVYQDVMVIGKLDFTYGLYGFSRDGFTVREISREVGLIDNRSAREKQGSLYWLSKRGIEKMTGPSITRVSDPVRDLIDTIIVAGGNSRSITDTTQTDFEAGNLSASGPGAPVSATISAGSLVPSTSTRVDTSSSNFVEGTLTSLTTGYYEGSLVLSTRTLTDDFTDGDYTSNPVWTVGGSDYWAVTSSRLKYDPVQADDDYVGYISIVSRDLNEGDWSYTLAMAKGAGNELMADFIFSASGSNPSTASGYLFRTSYTGSAGGSCDINLTENVCGTTNSIYRLDSGFLVLLSSAITATGGGFPSSVTITKVGSLITASFTIGTLTATDSTYTTSSNIILRATSGIAFTEAQHGYIVFDDITYPGFQPTGTFLSRIFDTSFSTPVYGPFSSTYTAYNSASEGNIAFYVQSSSANDGGGFTTIATTTDTLRPTTLDGKRYFRYRADFSTSVSTKTPRLDDVSLAAATTGYFISQCRNPGTAITSWGLFQCNYANNDGSLSYAISVGTTCHGVTRTTATWTAQTNNAVITSSTGSYVAYRTRFSIDSATQTPTLNDCTINWNEGASRPAVSAEVYRERYYLAYTSGTSGTVVNDHILVLDSRDQWTLHDAPNCSALGIYNRKIYCGDSGATGRVYQMDVGHNDDGASFTSTIKTKDFNFGNTWQPKILKRMYFDLAGLPNIDYSISLTPSYTLDASTDTFSLPSINLNEDYSRFIAPKVPASLDYNTTGRWMSFGLTNTGNQGPWKLYGIKAVFSRLTED